MTPEESFNQWFRRHRRGVIVLLLFEYLTILGALLAAILLYADGLRFTPCLALLGALGMSYAIWPTVCYLRHWRRL